MWKDIHSTVQTYIIDIDSLYDVKLKKNGGKPLWFFIAVLNIDEILKTKTKDCHHYLSLLTLE